MGIHGLAGLVAVTALFAAQLSTPAEAQVEPSAFATPLIEARLESVTVNQAELSVAVVMRPMRDVTIRGLGAGMVVS